MWGNTNWGQSAGPISKSLCRQFIPTIRKPSAVRDLKFKTFIVICHISIIHFWDIRLWVFKLDCEKFSKEVASCYYDKWSSRLLVSTLEETLKLFVKNPPFFQIGNQNNWVSIHELWFVNSLLLFCNASVVVSFKIKGGKFYSLTI